MTSAAHAQVRAPDLRARARHYARVLHVVASVDFKLKYADSALGYVWSLIKPLSYFTILWIVFGRFFGGNQAIEHYPLFLFTGIVIYTFFVDAISTSIGSVVAGGSMIRRLAFPRLILPLSATLTSAITFGINLTAFAVFIPLSRVTPEWSWLLIPLLLLELYLFIVGLAFLLSALFVRYRDVTQVWELAAQLLFYASPIMYPVGFLPLWFQYLVFLNPLVQVIQDTRALLVGSTQPHGTIASIYGSGLARALPVLVALLVFAAGLAYFRRRAPRFAEQV